MHDQPQGTPNSQPRTIGQVLTDSSSSDGKLGDLKEVDFACVTHGQQRVKVVQLTDGWAFPKCEVCAKERQDAKDRAEENRTSIRARHTKDYLIRNHLSKSALPARFESRDFVNYLASDPGSQKALSTCREYAETFPERLQQGSSLILSGNSGTGKTHLACSIANHVIRQHAMSAIYLTAGRAFRTVKDSYRRDSGRTEQEALSTFSAPELLILDEIGVQYGSDTEKNILFEIVNERYEAMKPTILISNLALPALTEYAGERVIDRMKENGGRLIVFDWKSHRGAA